MSGSEPLNLKSELQRKLIHISCTIFPLSYYFFLTREQILFISCFITAGFLMAEYLRHRIPLWTNLFKKTFFPLLRDEEKSKGLTGATYLFLSMSITIFVFDKNIAVPSLLMVTLADSFAAVAGKLTGNLKFFRKSVEGSITFFLFAIVILFIFVPGIGYFNVLIALLLTLIEALPVPVNDNILIPVSTGVFLILL